jgi:hypothetical protein
VTLTIADVPFTGTAHLVTDPSEMAHVVALLKKKYWLSRPYLWIMQRPAGAFRVDLDPTLWLRARAAPSTARVSADARAAARPRVRVRGQRFSKIRKSASYSAIQ